MPGGFVGSGWKVGWAVGGGCLVGDGLRILGSKGCLSYPGKYQSWGRLFFASGGAALVIVWMNMERYRRMLIG